MPRGKIIVEHTIDDKVTISVEGVKGKSCKDLTADLEKALGTVKNSTPTKEFYEKPLKAQQKVGQS